VVPQQRVAGEQRRERPLAPALERALNPLGYFGVGGEGIVEKLLQIPAQIQAQVTVGAALDRDRLRCGQGDGVAALAVAQPFHPKPVRIDLIAAVADDQRLGW
jgi:hypothetical protein